MRRSLLLATLLLAGCGGASKPDSACTIDRGELPSWATAGFSDPHPSAPHVLGDSHRITAVLFGDPLLAPPGKDRANKILWVAREPGNGIAALKIRAERDGEVVNRTVESGPGPSIVDLPAGCWKLSLSWGKERDTLDLRYAQGKPS